MFSSWSVNTGNYIRSLYERNHCTEMFRLVCFIHAIYTATATTVFVMLNARNMVAELRYCQFWTIKLLQYNRTTRYVVWNVINAYRVRLQDQITSDCSINDVVTAKCSRVKRRWCVQLATFSSVARALFGDPRSRYSFTINNSQVHWTWTSPIWRYDLTEINLLCVFSIIL